MPVHDAVASGLGELPALLKEYDALTGQFGQGDDDAVMERMHDIQVVLDAADAEWHKVETVLDKLNLPGTLLMRELSGGMQKRVALARAGVGAGRAAAGRTDQPPGLHLDPVAGRPARLQGQRAVHHRPLLPRQRGPRIIELDRGRLLSFPGNFSTYQTRKAELLENEEVENAKFDKVLAQEEVWIRKGVKARRVRDEGRVRRLEALRLQRARAASSRARSSWK
jgi:ATP-binding cassette subfamily F protein uup